MVTKHYRHTKKDQALSVAKSNPERAVTCEFNPLFFYTTRHGLKIVIMIIKMIMMIRIVIIRIAMIITALFRVLVMVAKGSVNEILLKDLNTASQPELVKNILGSAEGTRPISTCRT